MDLLKKISPTEKTIVSTESTSQKEVFPPNFKPGEACYFEAIEQQFQLQDKELEALTQNGFVISERLAFQDFSTAYAYLHWKDLPVLITTDSLLEVIHQNYSHLLKQLEELVFFAKLTNLLRATIVQLEAELKVGIDPRLIPFYKGLKLYLTVPLELLTESTDLVDPEVAYYLQVVRDASKVLDIEFFGRLQKIDFTLFKPRGHYTCTLQLEKYFRAISWLQHFEFCLAESGYSNQMELNFDQLIAALTLYEILERAGQIVAWQEFDRILAALVGQSDNTTLTQLGRFKAEAGITSVTELLEISATNTEKLLRLLSSGDFGIQKICGQILFTSQAGSKPTAHPVSFRLLGSRFVVDSYVMSELVFDRLVVQGRKMERALPSPLDVMYVLGNDRARFHLEEELVRYGYIEKLQSLRAGLDSSGPDFWTQSLYNQWLKILRTLKEVTTDPAYPSTMRTPVWADRMLHTQLASWSQLRHNTILYAKQAYTSYPICEYPAGYVEPYPTFYAALQDYAKAGQTLIQNLTLEPDNSTFEAAQKLCVTAQAHYANLEEIAAQLQVLADKELRQEAFSAEEITFIKHTAICHITARNMVCTFVYEKEWDGWYPRLFPWEENHRALIADVHTNPVNKPDNALYPPRVLHVGNGSIATLLMIVDTDEESSIYAGPAFTYYEVIQEGFPPQRLTDEEWRTRLFSKPTQFMLPDTDVLQNYINQPGFPEDQRQAMLKGIEAERNRQKLIEIGRPNPPDWTKNFRIASSQPPTYFDLREKATWVSNK